MKTIAYIFATIYLLSAGLLGCGGGGGGGGDGQENQPPAINNLTASPNPVAKGQTMTVIAMASDPNGDTLSYTWTVPAGYTIQSGQGTAQIVVLAMQFPAEGTVGVTVSDGSLTATSSVVVSTSNQPPAINNLTASPNPVAKGQTMTVIAMASDPNGDTLSYTWTVPAGYTIQSGQGTAQIVVLATQLLAKGNIEVKVSDGDLSATQGIAVSTNDGTWGTAGPIENDDGNSSSPQIATDANGNAIAVWTQWQCSNMLCQENIWANRYDAASGHWGMAGSINSGAESSYFSSLQIAMDAIGNAIAVWTQWQCSNISCQENILANRYEVASRGWGTARPIDSGAESSYSSSPQIAMDANGNGIVVWTQNDGNLWTNRYVVGVGWEKATPQTHAGYNYNPQIAMDAKGDTIIVWMQSGINILAKRYVAGGNWEKAVLIESVSGYPNLQIAMNAGGDAIVVWTQCTDIQCNQRNIWASRYVADKDWETAMQVETADLPGYYYYDPQIAMDASGNAIVVWTQCTDAQCNQTNIWANRYTAGTGWGESAQQIGADDNYNYSPRIAMDPNGNAIAVWTQCSSEVPCNIQTNRYVAGTGWGTAAPIQTNDQGNYDPQIAMAAGGDAVAVWYQWDGTLDNIWANEFK